MRPIGKMTLTRPVGDHFDETERVAFMTQHLVRGIDFSDDPLVGMEAHGNPVAEQVIGMASRLPKPIAKAAIESAGIDRLDALHTAIELVRRGGTLSISGVYGGSADPMPMMTMFDKGLTVKMGQCHVKAWTDELLDILKGDEVDALGVETLATHHLPLDDAPEAYETFQKKEDGCLKVVLKP